MYIYVNIYKYLKISKIKVTKILLKFRLLKVLLIIDGWLPKNVFLLELMLQKYFFLVK